MIRASCLKILLVAGVALGAAMASEARAALDPCQLVAIWPMRGSTMESIEAGIDKIGCTKGKSDSAHFKSWVCGSDSAPTTLMLLRQQRYDNPVTLVAENPNLSLHDIRKCLQRPASDRPHFSSASLVEADEVSVLYPEPKAFRQLTLGSINYLVGSTVPGDEGAKLVEQRLFGISRPAFPVGSVEIAGKNIISTPVDEVIDALKQRGSTIIADETKAWLRQIKLTPPSGLDGVVSVQINSVARHILDVTYVVKDLPSYEALIAAMEAKYGASTRVADKAKNCTYRGWESQAAYGSRVLGEHCPGKDAILLINSVMTQQHNAVLEMINKPPPPDAPKKRAIDRDNF